MGDNKRSNETIWHDEIEVGKLRKIAARGITPNHIGDRIYTFQGDGILLAFEHFDKTTALVLLSDKWPGIFDIDLEHLDEITVEH